MVQIPNEEIEEERIIARPLLTERHEMRFEVAAHRSDGR